MEHGDLFHLGNGSDYKRESRYQFLIGVIDSNRKLPWDAYFSYIIIWSGMFHSDVRHIPVITKLYPRKAAGVDKREAKQEIYSIMMSYCLEARSQVW